MLAQTNEPQSLLTRERPELWRAALSLATATTGMIYLPKLPGPNGEIWACGGQDRPVKQPSRKELERSIRERKKHVEEYPDDEWFKHELRRLEEELARRFPQTPQTKLSVFVPDGAAEWLLHEVGHWLAATPEERGQRNYGLSAAEYGHDGDREWQAWAFEEIVLAPWGLSRLFAPPSQRDGAAFAKAGPMPARHLRHIDSRLRDEHIDLAAWRAVYGEWVRWGLAKTVRPWDRVN